MADASPGPTADRASSVRSRPELVAPEAAAPVSELGMPTAILLMVLVLVVAGAVRSVLGEAWQGFGVGAKAGLLLYDAGQHLGVGLLVAGAVAAWQAWGPRVRSVNVIVLMAAAMTVGRVVLVHDLEGAAIRCEADAPTMEPFILRLEE